MTPFVRRLQLLLLLFLPLALFGNEHDSSEVPHDFRQFFDAALKAKTPAKSNEQFNKAFLSLMENQRTFLGPLIHYNMALNVAKLADFNTMLPSSLQLAETAVIMSNNYPPFVEGVAHLKEGVIPEFQQLEDYFSYMSNFSAFPKNASDVAVPVSNTQASAMSDLVESISVQNNATQQVVEQYSAGDMAVDILGALSDAFSGFSQARSYRKSQPKTSSNGGSQAKTKSKPKKSGETVSKAITDNNARHTYDNYVDQLSRMKTWPEKYYNDSQRKTIQQAMKNIREEHGFQKSSWEDWDGTL